MPPCTFFAGISPGKGEKSAELVWPLLGSVKSALLSKGGGGTVLGCAEG